MEDTVRIDSLREVKSDALATAAAAVAGTTRELLKNTIIKAAHATHQASGFRNSDARTPPDVKGNLSPDATVIHPSIHLCCLTLPS